MTVRALSESSMSLIEARADGEGKGTLVRQAKYSPSQRITAIGVLFA
jgi:hypothetical protein